MPTPRFEITGESTGTLGRSVRWPNVATATSWPPSCRASAMPTTPRQRRPMPCTSASSATAWWSGCTSCSASAVRSCSTPATCLWIDSRRKRRQPQQPRAGVEHGAGQRSRVHRPCVAISSLSSPRWYWSGWHRRRSTMATAGPASAAGQPVRCGPHCADPRRRRASCCGPQRSALHWCRSCTAHFNGDWLWRAAARGHWPLFWVDAIALAMAFGFALRLAVASQRRARNGDPNSVWPTMPSPAWPGATAAVFFARVTTHFDQVAMPVAEVHRFDRPSARYVWAGPSSTTMACACRCASTSTIAVCVTRHRSALPRRGSQRMRLQWRAGGCRLIFCWPNCSAVRPAPKAQRPACRATRW